MDEKDTISKKIELIPSQDYEFLRKEGLAHIESLSSQLWTDYNTHDPGITILEALCYAITELGYRSGFEMKDLVVTQGSEITDDQRVLFTAKNILTVNPLTIDDYRKLLVDIVGIHNAWLFAPDNKQGPSGSLSPVNEVPVYADIKNDVLTYDPKPQVLYLSGLYEVLLDLDIDDRFGDLNNGDILLPNPAIATRFIAGEFFLVFELRSWADASFEFAEKAADATTNHISTTTISTDGPQWNCNLVLDDGSEIEFGITLPQKPSGKVVTTSDIETIMQPDFLHLLFKEYLLKITKARKIVQTATKRLHERRNLCEDFITIKSVRIEEIAFCFDIDVAPSADIEKVQSAVFFAIENYLNPSVEFYSLREMLDKKVPVDEIFNGPVLEHGFIDTVQLQQTQLRSVIHTSDIINILMDIEGVLALRNFVMTKYDENGDVVPGSIGQEWCMHITPLYKPALSKEKSKIILFKNQFPFLARYNEVRDSILLLHAQASRDKLKGFQQDIPVPVGHKRDSEFFWPVQYEFPQTYGVGQHGLPANATPARIAMQRQLKAYLLFYEQLLADFFSQLSNAHVLFSVADLKHTYFAQFLGQIKDIEAVYKKNGIDILLEQAINNADSLADNKNDWQQLYEGRQLYQDRRSRFLDHLLARFAESFNDYALLMYRINYEERTETKISFEELTKAKIELLKEYPSISSGRGKAYNYFPQNDDFTVNSSELWDTENISGIEKRISSLTGITDPSRRFLYCMKNIDVLCSEKLVSENGNDKLVCFHEFSITTLTGITLKNSRQYTSKATAEQELAKVLELGRHKTNYAFNPADKNLHLNSAEETLMHTDVNTFEAEAEALEAADQFVKEFTDKCNDPVGLHLIEHILLRPRSADFKLMDVCLKNGDCPCEMDPYTFRASVVLPYWPGHFDNAAFREYFESRIQEEAPAHVQLKVCWLSNDLMREFEVRYKKWIEELAAYSADKVTYADTFRQANDEMVEVLTLLHSEYPLATLHNCDESKEGSNTVILGKTVLGTFKNQ
jgi:hypothetical protein